MRKGHNLLNKFLRCPIANASCQSLMKCLSAEVWDLLVLIYNNMLNNPIYYYLYYRGYKNLDRSNSALKQEQSLVMDFKFSKL